MIFRVQIALLLLACIIFVGCQDSRTKMERDFAASRTKRYQAIQQQKVLSLSSDPNSFNSSPESVKEADIMQLVGSEDLAVSGVISIDDCIELALRHSTDIQSAKIKVLEARANTDEAVSTALPTVELTGYWYHNDNTGFMAQNETRDLTLLFRQPLYLGGQIGAALDAADAYYIQVSQELRKAFQNVQFEVRKAFCDVQLARKMVDVAQLSLNNAETLYKDTEIKYKNGIVLKYELLRTRVSVTEKRSDLIRSKNALNIAYKELLNIVGISQASQVVIDDNLEYVNVIPDEELCLQSAITQHPDLMISETYIRLAKDNVVSNMSGNRPRLYLEGKYQRIYPETAKNFEEFEKLFPSGGSFGSSSGEDDMFFAGTDRAASVGLFLQWPLYTGKSTEAKVARAKANLYQQQNNQRKLEQAIQFDLESWLLSLNDSAALVEAQVGNVDNAKEALRLAQAGFKQGTQTSLDVITSELNLTDAQTNYAQAVHAYHVSILNLAKAIGVIGESEIPVIK